MMTWLLLNSDERIYNVTLLLLVPSYAGIDELIRPYLDRLCWPRMELKRFASLHLSRINVSAPQTNAIIPILVSPSLQLR